MVLPGTQVGTLAVTPPSLPHTHTPTRTTPTHTHTHPPPSIPSHTQYTLPAPYLVVIKQLLEFAKAVRADPKLAKGFDAVGLSQGNLLVRAFGLSQCNLLVRASTLDLINND
ncbi:hypothetical protein T492DRAFT_851002 [Pavlovales sp. CCMP2436]|nr:hypothetical protein T492DRAFT_851002 [Pavlovales sp. CCMP2436]